MQTPEQTLEYPITEQSKLADAKTGLQVPVSEIYVDVGWNHRDKMESAKIDELASSVAAIGLRQAIEVRDVTQESRDRIARAQGKKYVVVSGHRRFVVYLSLGLESIPAHKRGYLTDFDARDACAAENLMRVNLTFYEEAQAIKHYYDYGVPAAEVSLKLGKTPTWVARRYKLLECGTDIQDAAKYKQVTSTVIDKLHKLSNNPGRQAAALKALKQGGQPAFERFLARNRPRSLTRTRRRQEIFEKMSELQRLCHRFDRDAQVLVSDLITKEGNGLVTRVLAWACGEISDSDLEQDITAFAAACEHSYTPRTYEGPEFAHVPPVPLDVAS